MRRSLSLLLLILLLLTGCSGDTEAENRVRFCYPRSQVMYGTEDAVLAWEERVTQGDLETLLALYFQGPEDVTLVSPLPSGAKMCSAVQKNSTLTLTFTEDITALRDMKLTVSAVSISATCFALTDAQKVVLRTEDGMELFSCQREGAYLFYDSTPESTPETTAPK